MMVYPHPSLIAALLALYGSAPAWAQAEDTFRFSAAYSQQTDSNFFRLPAGLDSNALIGKPSAQEQIGITSLGFHVNKPYSLQRFELNLGLVDYRYRNFSHLSFSAHNYDAAWRWSLTPRLRGNLTSTRTETLSNFADYKGFNMRNQRTATHTRLDGEFDMGGPWRLLGGVSRSAQSNLQPVVAESDSRATSADLGVRYVLGSGSWLGYTAKTATGDYLNRALSPAGRIDDGFKQVDNELRLHWKVSAKTTADLRAAHIERTHPHYGERDYSGVTATSSLTWNITAKTALSTGWVREISSYQTASTNYTRTDRFTLGPVWQVSPKALVRLQHALARRDYLDPPAGAVVDPQRRDTMRDTTLSLDWMPHRNVVLGASMQKAKRTSNLGGLDYASNITTLTARFTY